MSAGAPAVGPRRTCVGCRRVAPAAELRRVARAPGGAVEVGRAAPGRGAWLCRDPACWALARRRRALARALRAPISEETLDRLGEELGP